jgi:histidinol dehydrogenase
LAFGADAGVKERVFCTPAKDGGKINPAMLYVASLCGARRFLRFGGVGAIGALAYGCEGLGRVEKIFGPGNLYVTEAKQQVSKELGGPAIDMRRPFEVLVVMDTRQIRLFALLFGAVRTRQSRASRFVAKASRR